MLPHQAAQLLAIHHQALEFDGPSRAQAFSLLGTSFGVGLALGPVLAGGLVAWLGWPAVFLSGAVLGLAAFSIGLLAMRESRDPDAMGLDWAGAISFTLALVLFTVGILQVPGSGWASPGVLALLAASACALLTFMQIELRGSRLMLDVTLFR